MTRRLLIGLWGLLVAATLILAVGWRPAASADAVRPSLAVSLAELTKSHPGQVGVAVKNLTTGESHFLRADMPIPAAGLIHLPVMFEVYLQAEEGKRRLTDTVTLRPADKVLDHGILAKHFSTGTTLSLRDAVRLMIAYSDPTALNLILQQVDMAAVNQRLTNWGLVQTRLQGKGSFRLQPSHPSGLGATTAREMVQLLEMLESGKVARSAVKQALLGHLKNCEDREKFVRFLPVGTMLAHTTGTADNIRNDAGILYLPDAVVVLCVLTSTQEASDGTSNDGGSLLCARIAQEVLSDFLRQR